MSFRSIVRDVRDSFGSLSRRSFEVRLPSHYRGKSHGSVHEMHEPPIVIQNSPWANLPPELLRDVIKRLEESESTWPARKHVVACAAVCRSWRDMCKEIVRNPEFCGKITFPVSLKQPGARDGTIQCFIKRDKSNLTYHLFLCLSPALLVENGKFLLSAKRTRRTTCTEYVISMDADNISRSSSTYIGKLSLLLFSTNSATNPHKDQPILRSNFLGTKFIIFDTQPPYNMSESSPPGRSSRRFSKKVSPKVPSGSFNIAQVTYELNVLGTRGPRKMHVIMHSIPVSSLEPGGNVPGQPELLPRSLEDSFRSMSFSKSIDNSTEFSSARFSDILGIHDHEDEAKDKPIVLRNKAPRWHEQLQCWCLNFKGRVTVASVKNFQLVAAAHPPPAPPPPTAGAPPATQPDHDKVILQFGKQVAEMNALISGAGGFTSHLSISSLAVSALPYSSLLSPWLTPPQSIRSQGKKTQTRQFRRITSLLRVPEMLKAVAMETVRFLQNSGFQTLIPPSPKICGTPNGPPVTSPRIKLSSGRHVAYRELGVPKDSARFRVLLIHGFDSSKDLFIPLSQEFMEKLSLYIVAIDRAGYGESDPNPDRTIKSETLDLQEFADELDLGPKFYVLGLSLGNYMTWGCLKYIPHRLAGAGLVVPVINYWWPSFPAELSNQCYKKLLKRDQWKLWISHNTPWLIHWWLTQKMFPSSTIMERNPIIFCDRDFKIIKNISQHKIRQQGDAESLYRDLKIGMGKWEFDPMEVSNPFPKNEGNVYVWQGYEDKLVPYEMQRYIAKKLPWMKYYEVGDGGHLIIHDQVLCEAIFKSLLLGEEPSFE
ncbi:hypothetical protein V2J09_007657 [Rumex salicifolius]